MLYDYDDDRPSAFDTKIVYFLNKEVIKLINENKINEARDLLIKVYGVLDKTKDEVIINRLKVYNEQTSPLLDYYTNKGLIKTINGQGDIAVIKNNILEVLA